MVLTTKEKADRYDALQAAIRQEIKVLEDACRRYEANIDKYTGVIRAFDHGAKTATEGALEMLRRWI